MNENQTGKMSGTTARMYMTAFNRIYPILKGHKKMTSYNYTGNSYITHTYFFNICNDSTLYAFYSC